MFAQSSIRLSVEEVGELADDKKTMPKPGGTRVALVAA